MERNFCAIGVEIFFFYLVDWILDFRFWSLFWNLENMKFQNFHNLEMFGFIVENSFGLRVLDWDFWDLEI